MLGIKQHYECFILWKRPLTFNSKFWTFWKCYLWSVRKGQESPIEAFFHISTRHLVFTFTIRSLPAVLLRLFKEYGTIPPKHPLTRWRCPPRPVSIPPWEILISKKRLKGKIGKIREFTVWRPEGFSPPPPPRTAWKVVFQSFSEKFCQKLVKLYLYLR